MAAPVAWKKPSRLSWSQGFDGSWIRVATQYDSFGRVSLTSRPYFLAANNPVWTTTSYNAASGLNDPLGRPQTVTMPSTGYTVYTYAGLATTVAVHPFRSTDSTFGATETTITTKNAQGLVHTVKDALNSTTTYQYDSEGNLLTVADPAGNVTTNTFDLRGRKHTASDPDMGKPGSHLWTYVYNAFGELVSQTDAKSQTTLLFYDLLGRLRHREEQGSSGTVYSNWVYNDSTSYTSQSDRDIGQLLYACTRSTSGSDCTGLASSDYLRSLTYDDKSRVVTVALKVDGTTNTYTTAYNTDGRVSYVKRPSTLRVDYGYVTTYGYLKTLTDHATSAVYWTANARDPEMHLTQWTAGNGMVTSQGFDPNTGLVLNIHAGPSDSVANFSYRWDSIGNLLLRQDMLGVGGGVSENFCYDVLNRVTNYALGASCTATGYKTMAYDALGNITTKSDVSTAGGYQYGGSTNAGPHALTSITSCTTNCMLVNGVTSPTFTYDANGNMTCELSSGQSCNTAAARYISWTAFNMVDKVVQSGPVPGGMQLVYDSEHARIKMCVPACSGIPATTTYLNAMDQLEEKFVSGSTTTWRDYIEADGKLIAERSKTGTTVTLSYFITDHLGSVSVVTDSSTCTSTSCNVTERDAYDAWGRRRNASDWSDNPSCAITSSTSRGFTGHEELDSLCLVNANARLYDPTVGRFLSADPTIEAMDDLQDLNRYSYVGNNPLSFTDPSGLCFLGCFWQKPMGRAAIAIVVAVILQEFALPELEGFASATAMVNAGQTTLLAVNAGVSGGVAGAINSGKWQGALVGAGEGLAFFGVGSGLQSLAANGVTVLGSATIDTFVAHGLVGGLASVASGGKFGSGFIAAGVGSLADEPAFEMSSDGLGPVAFNTAVHAAAGGLGSILGGGKFANGAVTGAFGYLFNSLAHAWAGTEANQALGRTLNERDGGVWKVNSTFWGVLLDGRADLINMVTEEVYEIKTNLCLSTPSCLADAKAQLNDYLEDAASVGLMAGNKWTVFRGMPNLETSGSVMGVRTTFVFSPFGGPDSGLIGYDRKVSLDWASQVMKSWAGRRSGGPAPMSLPWWAFP